MDIDYMIENYWANVWEEQNADTDYDKASDSDKWSFISNYMEKEYDEYEEEWKAEAGIERFTKEQRERFEADFLRVYDDEIAEKYNEWAAEQRRNEEWVHI